MAEPLYCKPAGDSGLYVFFPQRIHPDVHRRVRALVLALDRLRLPGLRDVVPSYAAVLIHYDPVQLSYRELESLCLSLARQAEAQPLPPARTLLLPVAYGGPFGPDLEEVARLCGTTPEEVIRLHSAPDYLVYFLGFTPGFPYLGGLDPRLRVPRLPRPRPRVPAGSVAIGGEQTGIYPVESPGGWRVIGRTPVPLYRPGPPPSVLLEPGCYVRFVPISAEEYHRVRLQVEEGRYAPQWVVRDDG